MSPEHKLAALRARVKKLRETGSTPAKEMGTDSTATDIGADSVTKEFYEATPTQFLGGESQPSWIRVLDSVDRQCYVRLDRSAYRHFERASSQLRNASDSPEAWLALMNCLKSTSVRNHISMESILRLYECATRNLNLRENRRNKAYVKLWLSYASNQGHENPDDSRDTFKYMRAHRIGDDTAELYETWALFEAQNGNADKAKKLFEEAGVRRSSELPTLQGESRKQTVAKPPLSTNSGKTADHTAVKKRGRTPISARKSLLSTGPARRVKQEDDGEEKRKGEGQDKNPILREITNVSTDDKDTQNAGAAITDEREQTLKSEERSVPQRPADEVTPSLSSAVKRMRLNAAGQNARVDSWSSLWTTYEKENISKSSGTESPEVSRHDQERLADPIPNIDIEDNAEDDEDDEDKKSHNYGEPANHNGVPEEIAKAETESVLVPSISSAPLSVLGSMSDAVVQVNNTQYLRLEMVGRGGSSKVYKVMGPDRKIYALKRVRVAKKDIATMSSYANEIKLLRRLRGKPHIVQLFDAEVKQDAGIIHLVMEFGDIDLARLLSRGRGKPVNTNFLRLYWQQMLEAVHTIHEERIVHGDLKPANFLLVEGALKLIDFGIAKAITSDDTTNILRDTQVGTPNYMSPEALLHAPDGSAMQNPSDPNSRKKYRLGRASDLWSLGCILYQMVCGRTPFAHLSMIQKLHCITDPSYEIQFPSMRNQYLLDDLKLCLQRDPARRPKIPELLRSRFLCPDQKGNASDLSSDAVQSGSSMPDVSRDMLSSILEQLRSMDVNIPTNALNDPMLIDRLLTSFRTTAIQSSNDSE